MDSVTGRVSLITMSDLTHPWAQWGSCTAKPGPKIPLRISLGKGEESLRDTGSWVSSLWCSSPRAV